jgi:hypothetical protein
MRCLRQFGLNISWDFTFLVKSNKGQREELYVDLSVAYCSSSHHVTHIDDVEA